MTAHTHIFAKLLLTIALFQAPFSTMFGTQGEQELKESAHKIEQENKAKIKLAREINDALSDYCSRANNLLDKLDIDVSKAPDIKNIDRAESLRNYLSTLIEGYFEENTKKTNNSEVNQKLFDATRNLTDSTIGIRKVTEFRLFEYSNTNKYVEQYDLRHMPCIEKLVMRLCKTAWSVKSPANEYKNNVIYSFKILFTLWNKTLDAIYDILEENGYAYVSKKGVGKKIADEIIEKAQSKNGMITSIKNDYVIKKELFEKTLVEKNIPETIQKIFMQMYNKLFDTNIDQFNFTVHEAIDMINSQIKATKNKDEFIKAMNDSFQSIKVFEWDYPALNPLTENLKNFHLWATDFIKKNDLKKISDEEFITQMIEEWTQQNNL